MGRNQPMRPWLVQRASLRSSRPAQITGIDSLFRFHYMGSAEFEFGGLPKSLRRVTAKLDKYLARNSGIVSAAASPAMIICDAADKHAQASAFLMALSQDKAPLKECSYFDRNLAGLKPDDYAKTDLWWDIDHDWFFCIGKETADLLMQGLRALRDRWAAEVAK